MYVSVLSSRAAADVCDAEATRHAFRGGYFHSGDLAVVEVAAGTVWASSVTSRVAHYKGLRWREEGEEQVEEEGGSFSTTVIDVVYITMYLV